MSFFRAARGFTPQEDGVRGLLVLGKRAGSQPASWGRRREVELERRHHLRGMARVGRVCHAGQPWICSSGRTTPHNPRMYE